MSLGTETMRLILSTPPPFRLIDDEEEEAYIDASIQSAKKPRKNWDLVVISSQYLKNVLDQSF